MPREIVQSPFDVLNSRRRAPVILGREIHDKAPRRVSKQVRLAEPHLLALASPRIVLEVCREAFLKFQCHAFAHDADTIHRVHQRLSLALEEVTNQYLDHPYILRPLAKK